MSALKNLDRYLYTRSKKEVLYIYILVALVIGFVMFYFIYPLAKNYRDKQEKRNYSLTTKLDTLQTTKTVLNTRITVLNKRIKMLSVNLKALKKQEAFYKKLTSLLSFAEFDQHKWAELVKDVVDNAKSEGMKVAKISNKLYSDENVTKKTSFLVKRMDLDMYLNGEYKNFIFYMYNFENTKDLVKVSEINVTSPTTYYMKISIYGFVK